MFRRRALGDSLRGSAWASLASSFGLRSLSGLRESRGARGTASSGTSSGRGFFAILRLYSPLAPFFDKSWRVGEIEPA